MHWIGQYCKGGMSHGSGKRATILRSGKHLLRRQHSFSSSSNDENMITLLQSCKQTSDISQIHVFMIKTGLDLVPFTLSKLLAYSAADVSYAASIFRYIHNPNLYMFNTMLRAYSVSDKPKQALDIFNYMRACGIAFDEFTYVSVLKSCANLLSISTGICIHSIVLRCGLVLFLNVKNTLLHFYCVSERIRDAHQLFDDFPRTTDLVTWNTLMGGYLHVSQFYKVVELFRQLLHRGTLNSNTMLSVLSATGELGFVLGAESLLGCCIKTGIYSNLNVASALIYMYGKVGSVDSSNRVFDEVSIRDVVLWNCLIEAYAKNSLVEEALSLLPLMKAQGLKPNSYSFVGLLSACATSGALVLGQRIHEYIETEQLVLDAILGTGLLNMYVKCGSLSKAIDLFDRIEGKDVMCWTALILGCGIHGKARTAISLYHRMEEEGLKPNEVTFLAVINACSHAGLVSEGVDCFINMARHYGLRPGMEHYGCVIDLLGRAGLLEDAHKLTKTLTSEGDATSWRALLAACKKHGNVELGELVKEELEKIGNEHPADLLSLVSTYAVAGRVPKHGNILEKIRNYIKEVNFGQSLKKEAGYSTILLSNQVARL